jgi:hypothetical protein
LRTISAQLPRPPGSSFFAQIEHFIHEENSMAAKLKVIDTSTTLPSPPRNLGQIGLELWRKVQGEYHIIDAGGVELLAQACAALDRAESLREQIDRDGEIVRMKGVLKDHPGLKHELANRAFITRAIARLGLDVEPVRAVGRPAGAAYGG